MMAPKAGEREPMGGRSVESLQTSNNAAAPLMKPKMDGSRAGLLLFREPSPSVCAGWAGCRARHEEKTKDTEANEGTLLDADQQQRRLLPLELILPRPSPPPHRASSSCYVMWNGAWLRPARRCKALSRQAGLINRKFGPIRKWTWPPGRVVSPR